MLDSQPAKICGVLLDPAGSLLSSLSAAWGFCLVLCLLGPLIADVAVADID